MNRVVAIALDRLELAVSAIQERLGLRRTLCPFKGLATHYTVSDGGRTAENAAWSYECPNPALREIAGYLAFYPGEVEVEAD